MSEKKSMMAIAIAKSICREYSTSLYSRVVYLENGTEFQIQLFNPYNFTIGAEIFINDEKLSNRLVLNPGERVWLERYLDVKKKFKFSTYEVEGNNKDVQEAIKNNGKIEVNFYKEIRKKEWTNYPITTIDYNFKTTEWGPMNLVSQTNDYVEDSRSTAISTNANCLDNKSCTTQAYYSNICGETAATNTKSNSDSFYVSSTANIGTVSTSCNNEMICETGIINPGSASNQKFDNVNIDFEYFPFVTENIRLLPISQKPFTANDLQKIYCTECGRKLKTNYKFCPYCGTKIE